MSVFLIPSPETAKLLLQRELSPESQETSFGLRSMSPLRRTRANTAWTSLMARTV